MAFTYFFRDLQTLDLVVDQLLPTIYGRQSIKIWDAGCASGEEPYTLAMLLAEKMGFSYKNIKIHATDLDISNQFGKIIKNGVYPYDKLKRIPKNLFGKYFEQSSLSNHYRIKKVVRDRVKFSREDLLSLKPGSNGFSLIVCKNVLLHQNSSERSLIIKMFHKSLIRGGLLAMEHTQKLPYNVRCLFEPVTNNAQVYRKIGN